MSSNVKGNSVSHKNDKTVTKFYALLVDKDTKKRIKKLSFNIEISMPNNTELVLLDQDDLEQKSVAKMKRQRFDEAAQNEE